MLKPLQQVTEDMEEHINSIKDSENCQYCRESIELICLDIVKMQAMLSVAREHFKKTKGTVMPTPSKIDWAGVALMGTLVAVGIVALLLNCNSSIYP